MCIGGRIRTRITLFGGSYHNSVYYKRQEMSKTARILFVLISFIYSTTSYGQATFGWNWSNEFLLMTEGKERFQLSFYYDNNDCIIGFHHVIMTDVYDSSCIYSKLDDFKQDLVSLQSKYSSWVETAKANNVQTVEKEIPCTIRVRKAWCSNIANPTSVEIRPYFIVRGGDVFCDVRVWQYWQYGDRSERNYHSWHLLPNDIPFILNAIDQGFKEYLDRESQKQKTEDLFR